MGQAKRRGTFEERRAAAIERSKRIWTSDGTDGNGDLIDCPDTGRGMQVFSGRGRPSPLSVAMMMASILSR